MVLLAQDAYDVNDFSQELLTMAKNGVEELIDMRIAKEVEEKVQQRAEELKHQVKIMLVKPNELDEDDEEQNLYVEERIDKLRRVLLEMYGFAENK